MRGAAGNDFQFAHILEFFETLQDVSVIAVFKQVLIAAEFVVIHPRHALKFSTLGAINFFLGKFYALV